MNAPVLRLNLKGDISQVREAAGQVQEFLLCHRCSEQARADCELAMVEGCNNAIKHRPPGSPLQPVILEVTIEHGHVELRITDHGPGFNWPQKLELPAPERESGRGLYLIRRLMDSASYVRGPDRNVLVLRKKLAPK
ncbi:MAG TPA: ATP-binding protein [Verrucomicrobiae bacterium]|jgi:serine/threonine-protein kinase RsbW|nr:ATP-binding protein [Verrucomicrobiae bacterium]